MSVTNESWDKRTRSVVAAPFEDLGDGRRQATAQPRNALVALNVVSGLIVWHRAGEEFLRCAGPEILLVGDPCVAQELGGFGADAIALISAFAVSREIRGIIEERGRAAQQRLLAAAPGLGGQH